MFLLFFLFDFMKICSLLTICILTGFYTNKKNYPKSKLNATTVSKERLAIDDLAAKLKSCRKKGQTGVSLRAK